MRVAMTKQELKHDIEGKLKRHFGRVAEEATPVQMYNACAFLMMDKMMDNWRHTQAELEKNGQKEVYYLSVEFLIGRLFTNNMINLGLKPLFEDVLGDFGFDINEIEELENDPALGNGGLGRLAACYMDSLSTMKYPAWGCTIRYEYGIFKQKIIDGMQVELPDEWLDIGDAWQVLRMEDRQVVSFGGTLTEKWEDGKLYFHLKEAQSVYAVPYDMPISGYDSTVVNTLRLWQPEVEEEFDMFLFNQGEYLKATENKAMTDMISKVLYPNDEHYEGKSLRLKQQYFFVSATIQNIIKKHKRKYPIHMLAEKVAIHINDTHPTVAIPEFMRILLDIEELPWDEAWEITTKVFSYTNHTVLQEALERWPVKLIKDLLPRVFMIINEINERFCKSLWRYYSNDFDKISKMAIVAYNEVRMANLCVAVSHHVNGVSKLHSDIIKNDLFKDFYYVSPNKFTNVTNGVTPRRWLCEANPNLSELITETIGESWITDLTQLNRIEKFSSNASFVQRFDEIKTDNKTNLAKYIYDTMSIKIDPNSIFDVQVKRMHEYKRQMLNVFNIIHLYNKLLENPGLEIAPRTFIFAAKSAPGYHFAKKVIRLICSLGDLINNDPRINDKLKVVFLENYRVTLAEKIIPAANVSEQISTAGKEASGTGNMKLMLNGAVTIGTMDGANVEIYDAVGAENIFIFGLSAQEADRLSKGCEYSPSRIYKENESLKRVLDFIKNNRFHGVEFSDIFGNFVYGKDQYLHLADFMSYVEAQERVDFAYKNREEWSKKAIINVARSGIFTSDRSVTEYAENIWNLKKVVL